MMSTVAETVEWIKKKRSVWSTDAGTKVSIGYLKLNLIDDYNNNMNNIDLADQLHNCYQFNHWLCNRKWWWAIYLWVLGVAATNAYMVMTTCTRTLQNQKTPGVPWCLEFFVPNIKHKGTPRILSKLHKPRTSLVFCGVLKPTKFFYVLKTPEHHGCKQDQKSLCPKDT
jgi:hypothetical protein